MNDWNGPALPAAIARAKGKIDLWRQQHRPRARLSDGLWSEAAKLGCVYGINRTARALRLDYYGLKKHAAAAEVGERVPEFVEIMPGAMPAPRPECMIEIEDASGARMRIHLQGGDFPDIATLARVFREGR